jgi:uncharacterized protein with PQ loop repeat
VDWTAFFGWVAAAVGLTVGLPQFVQLRRTRDTAGVSFFLWQLTLTVNVIWIVHGVLIGSLSQVLCNVCGGVVTCSILGLLHSTRGVRWIVLLGPGLAAATLLIVVDLVFGSAAFGAVACVPAILGNLGQSVKLVRSPIVTGVSALYLVVSNVNLSLWVTWGKLVGDPGTFISSVATWVVIGFNLVWWALRQLGVPAFFGGRSVPAEGGQRGFDAVESHDVDRD